MPKKKLWWICEEEEDGIKHLFLHDDDGRQKISGTRTRETYPPIWGIEVAILDEETSKRKYKKPIKVGLSVVNLICFDSDILRQFSRAYRQTSHD